MGVRDGDRLQRRRILVQGIVQGVGFRPFVYAQASSLGLAGFVFNDSAGVTIEVEGKKDALDAFQRALREEAPPLAHVNTVIVEAIAPRHESTFIITQSKANSERSALISPDTSVCEECLRELFDPADRRYQYPFINCTNCGPRFTIVQDVPYDRAKTTMSAFPLCPTCQTEYNDPLNRRFHAQPNACPTCGPQLQLLLWNKKLARFSAAEGCEDAQQHTREPLVQAAQRLASGAILAIKGLGGYHLACNALDVDAVQRLRQRKHREVKPFALMVPDLATAHSLCQVSAAEAAQLEARQRPIVLLTQRPGSPLAPGVAPTYNTLGLMLPYTPLHYLLLHALATLSEPGHPVVLVMTSGNLSDEPIAYRDEEAYQRLKTLADGVLTHNREIHIRCDDSVLRVAGGDTQFFRRARGYAPEPLTLAQETAVPLLACGGHLKNTFCLAKGRQAFLSQHIGDLENLETLTSFQEGIAHFQQLFTIAPAAVAYDLHPEYLASKYALSLDVPHKIGVQHHHAHIASAMAEHALPGPVIGIALDGTGYGTDGAIWGCEVMHVDYQGFQRLAHLAYVPLPGGEQAVLQPWRMAAVYLQQSYGPALLELDIPFTRQLNPVKWRILDQMIARGINCPSTSSLGRLFDAVAALLGLPVDSPVQRYEGQAAIELEQLASTATGMCESYPFAIGEQTTAELDVRPLIRAIVDDIRQEVPASRIARRFHSSIASLLAQTCAMARERTGLNTVALSGGVWQNRLLLEELSGLLADMAFQVYTNRRVPPNDGGLSFGQLAIAAARLRTELSLKETVQEHGLLQEQEVSYVSRHSR
jgi:hydrogenase maturation protein HypF